MLWRAVDTHDCVKPYIQQFATRAVTARAAAAWHAPVAAELLLHAGEAAGDCGGAPGLEPMPKAGQFDSVPKGAKGLPGSLPKGATGLPGSGTGSTLLLLGSMLLLLGSMPLPV